MGGGNPGEGPTLDQEVVKEPGPLLGRTGRAGRTRHRTSREARHGITSRDGLAAALPSLRKPATGLASAATQAPTDPLGTPPSPTPVFPAPPRRTGVARQYSRSRIPTGSRAP